MQQHKKEKPPSIRTRFRAVTLNAIEPMQKDPISIDVRDIKGEVVRQMELDSFVFATPFRQDIAARVIRWQLAKRQQGTHSSKGVSDISGTTRKPWKQKGTGRARAGSLRSPQFRGGACIFGPKPRSHAHDMPKKIRRLALRMAFSEKVRNGALIVVDNLHDLPQKTSHALECFQAMALKKTHRFFSVCSVVTQEILPIYRRSVANLPHNVALPPIGANVYDLLRHDYIYTTPQALEEITTRLKRST